MQESIDATKDAIDVHRLFERAARQHAARFARSATILVAAPGRVNLIGEHTDYNDGFVFPMAIERYVVIAASRSSGRSGGLRVHSDTTNAIVDVPLDSRPQRGVPEWGNYVRGIVAGFLDRGFDIPSVDLTVTSSVPLGAGLSSSAALEVAVASTLESVIGQKLDPFEKARLCQAAEHEFAGVPCGLMDQLASVLGRRDHALFIDCRSEEARLVPLRDDRTSILICNSKVKHSLADGEYAKRREQCQRAATVLGVKSLRDTTIADVHAAAKALGDLHYRRARHVVTENQRTVEFGAALAQNDLGLAGRLMYESHASLRDDYEVSCRELDVLVSSAKELGPAAGVHGSRMTGGGFGGSTVSLVQTDRVESIVAALTERYLRATGKRLEAFVTRPSEGLTLTR